MSSRLKRIAFAGAVAACLTGAIAPTVTASYHDNLIREVHEGPASVGDYVELQAHSAGQNLIAGKHIVSYDGGGSVFSDYTIPSTVPNGANQATILIANAASVGGVVPDFTAGSGSGAGNLNVINTGGTVCFTDSSIAVKVDCVAFDGAGGGATTVPVGANFGTPFALPGANLDGQSLIRKISSGCATLLDAADDTNTAADFDLGAGNPRNNAAPITETACPPGNPTSPVNPAGNIRKRKCKKKQKRSAEVAKQKKCKKKKRR
jgi:hypothetical protein